ncbi:hypothetical protein BACPLE_00764 [Phocaeicola plebeius DSM 17135]|uniref:Uncharacterized protein n=1 Tax=Phocaeicola plebeius (strain DSM 17135 / JCM 12973 / CCUG 54634 / M2) TaxID=484018 RepID=B5CVN1_PHOPM|nr:hypothetical protein BACPLE_00764 [Phocaeicola plebeius DSM 17135]
MAACEQVKSVKTVRPSVVLLRPSARVGVILPYQENKKDG